MNPEPEQFENLRRLLALKRHEQPPPGYFDRMPGLIMARIKAGERGESSRPVWFWEVPWIERIWTLLEARPVLAGGFGVALCAGLFSAVLFSENADNVPGYVSVPEAVSTATSVADVSGAAHPFIDRNIGLTITGLAGTNLNAGADSAPSLFERESSVRPQLVNGFRGER
jgi:hypothetical protein